MSASKAFVLAGALAMSPMVASAQPKPGDVFREYPMATGMHRIGERWEWGGSNSGKSIALGQSMNGPAWEVDLEGATRAEVLVSFDQCHEKTTGLRIAFNDHDYIPLPIPEAIPQPRKMYMFWVQPTVPVPLTDLATGKNVFKMRVDADPQPQGNNKGWMQNLVYAVVLRVYYGHDKPHATGKVTSPAAGDAVGRSVALSVETKGDVKQVDYIGLYEDFDYEGNGIWRQWHYTFDLKAQLADHLGTSTTAPYSATWDASWVPDQPQPMQIAARIVDANGMIHLTPAVENITLNRPGYSIELCKPFDVPARWVTRVGDQTEKFNVTGDLSKAGAAIVRTRVWKYEPNNPWLVNGRKIGELKTTSGVVTTNDLPVTFLKSGENTITTAKFGHHGVEICLPGIVPLIRYETGD